MVVVGKTNIVYKTKKLLYIKKKLWVYPLKKDKNLHGTDGLETDANTESFITAT